MADDHTPQSDTPPGSGADSERFAAWYRLYHERILAQCTRMLRDRAAAEDITHETLLRAWFGRDRMREEDLGAWLSVVSRNLCISHIRKQGRMVPTLSLPETPEEDADPAAVLLRKESSRSVHRALAEVGEQQRRVLYMREFHGLDVDEIGSELGLTNGGTRAALFRARRTLRRRLAAVGEGLGGWLAGVRIRITTGSTRARVAMRGSEAGLAPSIQAGLTLALAAGIAFSGVSGTDGRAATTPRRPVDVAAEVARADAVRAPATPAAPSIVPIADGREGGGTPAADRVLASVPKSPVSPPFAKDPNTGEEHLSIDVGPYHVYDVYGWRYDAGPPCITCDEQDKAMTIVCSYDPRFCQVD